jgi:ABC-type uncharacterized transport system auxiliary subunit
MVFLELVISLGGCQSCPEAVDKFRVKTFPGIDAARKVQTRLAVVRSVFHFAN